MPTGNEIAVSRVASEVSRSAPGFAETEIIKILNAIKGDDEIITFQEATEHVPFLRSIPNNQLLGSTVVAILEKHLGPLSVKAKTDELGRNYYITFDGNIRYFHSPKGLYDTDAQSTDKKATFTYGATQCPFESSDEIRRKTRVPLSLGETDFFTNYVNARNTAEKIITDSVTGNRYYDVWSYEPNRNSVDYEGELHWNIQRFLIEPHFYDTFGEFHVPKDKAKLNVVYDLYKYFLYQDHAKRDLAWQHANDFYQTNVAPIVDGKAIIWMDEKMPLLSEAGYHFMRTNIYLSNDKTNFVDYILDYNAEVFSQEIQANQFSKQDVYNFLVNYNIEFRKKSPEDAQKIANDSINAALTKVRETLAETEARVLQQEYTQDNKNSDLQRWKNHRFID